ncbi:unnamed protein product, partial [Heterobilharzia americana]
AIFIEAQSLKYNREQSFTDDYVPLASVICWLTITLTYYGVLLQFVHFNVFPVC